MNASIASVEFSVPVSELKEFAVQALNSSFVAARAGADLSAFEAREITVRGRAEAMAEHLITLRAICPDRGGSATPRRRGGRVHVKVVV